MELKKRLSRRGISPLISAVLIIGFTVALGSVIFLWASSFLEERTEKSLAISEAEVSCTLDVSFSVDSACYDNNNVVRITVSNNKNTDIRTFIVRVEGSLGSKVVDVVGVDKLRAKQLESISITVQDNIGSLERVVLIPTIASGIKEAQCSDQQVKVDLIPC